MNKLIRTKPAPYCDNCGVVMILRRPKPNQDWETFWGCWNYPKCRFTMNIDEDGYPCDSDYDDDRFDAGVDIWETANG